MSVLEYIFVVNREVELTRGLQNRQKQFNGLMPVMQRSSNITMYSYNYKLNGCSMPVIGTYHDRSTYQA